MWALAASPVQSAVVDDRGALVFTKTMILQRQNVIPTSCRISPTATHLETGNGPSPFLKPGPEMVRYEQRDVHLREHAFPMRHTEPMDVTDLK